MRIPLLFIFILILPHAIDGLFWKTLSGRINELTKYKTKFGEMANKIKLAQQMFKADFKQKRNKDVQTLREIAEKKQKETIEIKVTLLRELSELQRNHAAKSKVQTMLNDFLEHGFKPYTSGFVGGFKPLFTTDVDTEKFMNVNALASKCQSAQQSLLKYNMFTEHDVEVLAEHCDMSEQKMIENGIIMEKVKISRPKMDHEWTEKLAEVLKKLELEKELLENLEKNWDKDREQLQLLQKQQAESANGFRKILQGIGASEYNNGMFEGLKAIVGHQVSLVQSQAEALKLQEMVNKKRDLDVKNAIERQQKEQKAVQSAEKNWAIAKKNTLDIMVAYMAIHKVEKQNQPVTLLHYQQDDLLLKLEKERKILNKLLFIASSVARLLSKLQLNQSPSAVKKQMDKLGIEGKFTALDNSFNSEKETLKNLKQDFAKGKYTIVATEEEKAVGQMIASKNKNVLQAMKNMWDNFFNNHENVLENWEVTNTMNAIREALNYLKGQALVETEQRVRKLEAQGAKQADKFVQHHQREMAKKEEEFGKDKRFAVSAGRDSDEPVEDASKSLQNSDEGTHH